MSPSSAVSEPSALPAVSAHPRLSVNSVSSWGLSLIHI